MRPYQLKKFAYIKEYNQKCEVNMWTGFKIYVNYISDTGLITKIYKEFLQCNYWKNKLFLKNGKEPT